MNIKELNAWWQLQPQELKQELVKCGLPDDFWQQTDGSTKKGIHKLCLSRDGGQPMSFDRERSLASEVVCCLADMALTARNRIPLEDMCNEEGEFLEEYQEQFNRIYDNLERAIMNYKNEHS